MRILKQAGIILMCASVTFLAAGCSGSSKSSGASSDVRTANRTSSQTDKQNESSKPLPENGDTSSENGGSAVSSAVSVSAQTNEISYKTYENSRFGYAVDYPSLFIAGETPDNGDGESFATSDSKASLSIWGEYNVFNLSPEQYLTKYAVDGNKNISYKSSNSVSYICSWKDGGKIYYQFGKVGKSVIVSYKLAYPEGQKEKYDAIIKHINANMTVSKLNG